MSRWIPAVFFVALLAAISFVAERDSDPDRAGLPTAGIEREEVYGHAAQESMLASVHHPYGVSPPPQVLADLEEILLQYPGEGDDPQSARRSLSEWELIGPAGMVVRGSNPPEYNSGRIRDMDLTSAGLRVAAASGGLWEWFLNFPVPLSDNDVTTQWIGSFDTHPEASDIIVLATGEPGGTGGTGVWRTDDGGANWTQTLTGSLYSQAHRLRFDPFDDQNQTEPTAGFLLFEPPLPGVRLNIPEDPAEFIRLVELRLLVPYEVPDEFSAFKHEFFDPKRGSLPLKAHGRNEVCGLRGQGPESVLEFILERFKLWLV